jgi:hypothetical protein
MKMTETKTRRTISICADGIWVGSGWLNEMGHVEGCGAVLGGDPDTSETHYEAIDDALDEGQDTVAIDGIRYTWTLGIILAETVRAELIEIGESVRDVTRELEAGREPCVSHTPNGREIRVAKDGSGFLVQPETDNYWMTVPSIDAAMDAFENPRKYR